MTVKEIKAMTGIRGAAAVFVMVYHFEYRSTSNDMFSAMLHHGYLSVDLFFVLSGFVMAHVYGRSLTDGAFRFRSFLWHRVARIYPLYIFSTLAILLLAYLKTRQLDVDVPTLVSNMLMLQLLGNWPSIDAPAWSVSAETVAYLLFPVIAFLCLRSSRAVAMMIALAAIATILAMTIAASMHEIGAPTSRGPLDLFFEPYAILRCLAGFTLGQLVWRLHNDTRVVVFASRNSVQIVLAVFALLAMTQVQADFVIYLLIVVLILCLSTDHGPLSSFFGSPPIYFLGTISFAIYLTHYRALGIWTFLDGRFDDYGEMFGNVVATLLSGLIVIGLAWLLHVAIEKPCRQLLRGRRSRGASKPAVSMALPTGTQAGD